jgi:hypothetical protein
MTRRLEAGLTLARLSSRSVSGAIAMPRSSWKWLVAGTVILVLGIGYDRTSATFWTGSTNLEIEFTVSDAASGAPIPGARIDIESQDWRDEKSNNKQFSVLTDDNGLGYRLCPDRMCGGERSALGITNTWSARLPYWRFSVSAPSYDSSDWSDLYPPAFKAKASRIGMGKAKVAVPVALHKTGS